MTDFVPGQRVISDTEPELGLGKVAEVTLRTLRVDFPATGESRTYALPDPPLHRVRFSTGDSIRDQSGQILHIESVTEQDGLLVYHGRRDDGRSASLPEAELDPLTRLNKPRDRLLSGQIDSENWFRLRYEGRQQLHALLPMPIHGLCGARVSLIPHQLYIAHEVSDRPAARVLLADEVGLGKTIEAGLILHRQVLSGRVDRILLLVPPALLHQWLVEMLRRFNLRFSLFDAERCEALAAEGDNPFLSEQLVLCSLELFMENPPLQAAAREAGWDTLVVDEAHHLQWQPDRVSPEYRFVEQLAGQTRHVLLLTATPEQLGVAGHFARLRLLDPDRFHDLDTFVQEEQQYQPIARAAAELIDAPHLSDPALATLRQVFHNDPGTLDQLECLQDPRVDTDRKDAARDSLLQQLIDRHGTGRVLFRNTRSAVKGFPMRQRHLYRLPAVPDYQVIHTLLGTEDARQRFASNFHRPFAALLLTPEVIYRSLQDLAVLDPLATPHWLDCDPRPAWLAERLREHRHDKVLVICAAARTAVELEEWLRQRKGLRVAAFHEDMRILERDRAAAWFAETDGGAQALICSEIGSEGRNFQFAHHLILFDLPLNPDLLEQRIGRLDRIGQQHTIQIHVPWLEHSAQAIMLRWYDEALQAFTRTCPAGPAVFEQLADRLLPLLESAAPDKAAIEALIRDSRQHYEVINQRLQEGRDRLLELNSFRPEVANDIRQRIEQQDRDPFLADYFSRLCDAFGVEVEHHSAHSVVLRPSDHMQVHHFPELKADGVTATWQRDTALVHEDRQFLSWEHPMVSGALELLLDSERGNAALSVCKLPGQATGSLLLEVLYRVECIAPPQLQVNRFMPPGLIRILLDASGQDRSEQPAWQELTGLPVDLGKQTVQQIITSQQATLRRMLEQAESHAAHQLPALREEALLRLGRQLNAEIGRLVALQQVNPSVRQADIDLLRQQKQQLQDAIQAARLQLDAVRVIIAA